MTHYKVTVYRRGHDSPVAVKDVQAGPTHEAIMLGWKFAAGVRSRKRCPKKDIRYRLEYYSIEHQRWLELPTPGGGQLR